MTTRSITTPAAEPQAAVAAIEQPGPSAPAAQARALWHADGLRARFRGIGARERWGYGVWLFAGLVFGVPESWAGITSPPWPALSDTVCHLEQLWHPVKADGVEPATLELVHLRASRINGCSACVDSGARSARKAGETDERLATVAAWRGGAVFQRRRAGRGWRLVLARWCRRVRGGGCSRPPAAWFGT